MTFEFRQANGLAGTGTPKARVAAALHGRLRVKTFVNGVSTTNARGLRMNVAMYQPTDRPARRRRPMQDAGIARADGKAATNRAVVPIHTTGPLARPKVGDTLSGEPS